MAAKPLIRPGGRSERIQQAVHTAVRELRAENPGAELTIYLVAERAEVPPSTIYRRWKTIGELVADVATQTFKADAEPVDTGSLRGDLTIWLEHFVEDISSGLGFSLLKERLANIEIARHTAGYAHANFETFVNRAKMRNENAPDADRLMDLLVAPIIYRLIFAGQTIQKGYQLELIDKAFGMSEILDPSQCQPSLKSGALDLNSISEKQ